MLFRKIKNYHDRKIVKTAVKDFAKKHTYASSTLDLFIKDDITTKSVVERLYEEVGREFINTIPSLSLITAELLSFSNNAVCIRCYATESDGYFVHGVQIWIKHGKNWKAYNYSKDMFVTCKDISVENFKVTCCGCCGDVNTFYHFQEIVDHYFVY